MRGAADSKPAQHCTLTLAVHWVEKEDWLAQNHCCRSLANDRVGKKKIRNGQTGRPPLLFLLLLLLLLLSLVAQFVSVVDGRCCC